MKVLMGAACVAIIAFVGYFFWNQYSEARAKERQEFANNCWRLIATRPEYDKSFAESMGAAELENRLRKCVTFFESGKLPR